MFRPLVLAASLFMASAHADGDPHAGARAEFRRAYDAAIVAAAASPTPDSEALQTYPLYPYLQAARLRRAISDTPDAALDEQAQTFLTMHGRTPVTRELRADWLASLAKRQLWEPYVLNYAGSDDAVLRCHSFTALISLQRTEQLEPAVIESWLTPRNLPGECDPAIDWLKAREALTPELIEQRARLALKGGNAPLARQLARSLSGSRTQPLLQWASLIEQPQKTLDSILARTGTKAETAALLDGWTRLARRDQDAAMHRFDRLVRARKLDAKQASPYALELALTLAWSRRSEALKYFSRVDSSVMDERGYEWHARAALWAGQWQTLARALQAMPESLSTQTRWRYWAARSAEHQDENTRARELYSALTGEDNFYAAMAAARLGVPYAPHPRLMHVDHAQLQAIAQQPALLCAGELIRMNLKPLATNEWLYGYDQLTPAGQAQAIALAAQWQWYDMAVATATRQKVFEDYPLLYPRPYDAEVLNAAEATRLPPELIYAIVRQESLYRSDAVSSAGATGLMQLLYSTARNAARRAGLSVPDRSDLFVPQTNIRLGATELRGLIDRFDGQRPVAIAAYNAGPNAAARWLPPRSMEVDVWIENIPYNETRTYVQRVLWHSLVFNWLVDQSPQDLSGWLTKISRTAATETKAGEEKVAQR